ncbi:MAG: hypothetical protein RLZZ488_787 [Pseudomonadota bacterium]
MNSIRSELNALIVGEYRSRDSTPAGLFSITATLFSACAGAIAAEILAILWPDLALLARLAAIIWTGTRMRSLGNMMHECSHGIFVRSPSANTHFGHLLSAFDLSSFSDYARQHTTHHAYLGDPERDLDLRSRAILFARRKTFFSLLTLGLYALVLVPLWISMLRPVFWAAKAPRWSNVLRIALLALTALGLLLPQSQFFTLIHVVLPYMTVYQWMRFFSDACDHVFLTCESDPLERSRNHLFRPDFLNRIFFPRQDAYHLLHHLFPSLPTCAYPAVHRQLLLHPWYKSRSHALIGKESREDGIPRDSEFVHGQSR